MKAILSLLLLLAGLSGPVSAVDFTGVQAGRIAQVVGRLLESNHYKQTPLNDAVSEMFLNGYFDALDFNHMFFLQTDLDEFEKRYGTKLDDLINHADASPGFAIFDRYLSRLEERNEFVQKVLKEEFDFTKDEKFQPSRNKSPWPKDSAEASELWRARVKFELLQGRLAKEKPEETLKTISKRYNRLVKTMREYDSEDILQIYLTALAHTFDPHSDYMTPTEATNFDINNVKLSLSGIGALLRSEDGYARIVSLVPGGPADLSKQLKPKDRIIAVAQGAEEPVDTIEMKLSKVVDMIRGKRDSEVRLTIIPASSPDGSEKKVVRLIRDEIKLTEQYAKAKVFDHPDDTGKTQRLGVITLPQFYDNCARDVEKLIERLNSEHINGLVLDLRRNGGGILQEAIALTGLFIKKGPVVQVKDSQKRTQILRDEDSKLAYDGPLIVLVGHLSASASEIVAAALQDYDRALVVGDQSTHGKGTVQTLQSLNPFFKQPLVSDAGKLKFTISKFYRIAGGTTQKHGVSSDLVLPSITDYMELGEASLPNCLEADNTTPLEYNRLGKVKPFLSELERRSKERVAGSIDFGYVNQDIELLKKQRADKSISLNEAKRLEEKREQKDRLEARKQERAQRKPINEQVFDLNLEMVDKKKPLALVGSPKTKEGDALALTEDSAHPKAGSKAATEKGASTKVAPSDKAKSELATTTTRAKEHDASTPDGDPDADDPEAENDSITDAQLSETLNILNDYVTQTEKFALKSAPENTLQKP
jgi:carboxyl-terminal processing protease